MSGNYDEGRILSAMRRLVAAGIAIHWLRPNEKAPVEKNWTTAAVHTVKSAEASYRRGYNLGVRTGEPSKTPWGYLHLIDLDVRDPTQAGDAWDLILRYWPEARQAPYVVSGSGGESRHLYFFTDKPFRKLTLGKSAKFTPVYDKRKERDVRKYDWEVVLYGTDVQAVLPPSVHPDTGRTYEWGREIDFDDLDLGIGPILDSEIVAAWGATSDDDLSGDDDEDDLIAIVRQKPMGLSEDEIERVLDDLPEDWVDDRDQWYQVGMALHHEYEGKVAGFERWSEWSAGSPKYDPKDQARVWKSFKGDKRPVRMATLIKAAGEARDRRERADLDDAFDDDGVDDLDDLLSSTGGGKSLVTQAVAADFLGANRQGDADDLDDLLGGPVPTSKVAKKPTDEFDPDWETYMHRDEEGQIKSTSHNLELIVRNDKRTRGILAFNEFSQEVVLIRDPKSRSSSKRGAKKPIRQLAGTIWTVMDEVNGDLWSDSHDRALRVMLEAPKSQGGYQIKVTDRDLIAAIDMVAQRQRFHPVRSYLKAQTWDLRRRVERFFIDYFGAPDDAYHREAAMLFFIGAVTRVFEPGHKFDFVPIFEGVQGKGKTTAIEILGRPWYCVLTGDLHDRKAMVESMQGSWIIEIKELSALRKADQETLKDFIDTTVDKVRMSYDRRAKQFYRQCVFIGSTNNREYLDDPTGGRRWWPIHCTVGMIDTARLSREISQIWAEAYHMYLEWRRRQPVDRLPLYLRNEESVRIASRLQDSRRKERSEDVLLGQIEDWLEKPVGFDLGMDDADDAEPRYHNSVCGLMVWVEMMGRDENDFPPQFQQRIAGALDQLKGWSDPIRERTNGKYGRQRWRHRIIPR